MSFFPRNLEDVFKSPNEEKFISAVKDLASTEDGTAYFTRSLQHAFAFDDKNEYDDMPAQPSNVIVEAFVTFSKSPATVFVFIEGEGSEEHQSYAEDLAMFLTEYVQPYIKAGICIISVVVEADKISELLDLRDRAIAEYREQDSWSHLQTSRAKSRSILQAAQVAMALGAFVKAQGEPTEKNREMGDDMMFKLKHSKSDIFEKFLALGRVLYSQNLRAPRLALIRGGKQLSQWTSPTLLLCKDSKRKSELEKELCGILKPASAEEIGKEGENAVYAEIKEGDNDTVSSGKPSSAEAPWKNKQEEEVEEQEREAQKINDGGQQEKQKEETEKEKKWEKEEEALKMNVKEQEKKEEEEALEKKEAEEEKEKQVEEGEREQEKGLEEKEDKQEEGQKQEEAATAVLQTSHKSEVPPLESPCPSPTSSFPRRSPSAGSLRPRQSASEDEGLLVFDKFYNKLGKVQVFPHFTVSKLTLYKEVKPPRPPPLADKASGPQGSRKQKSPASANESGTEDVSLLDTESQQQGEEGRGTASDGERQGTSQDLTAAKPGPVPSQEASVEDPPTGKKEQMKETKTKKKKNKELKSYVLDEEKLTKPDVVVKLEAEDWEFLVLQRTKAALEEIMNPDDPPVLLLHNQELSSQAARMKASEKDVIVLHPHLGVLLLVVKEVSNTRAFSRFDEATAELLHAQESVQEEMGDLLEKDAVVLTIALPKLRPEDSSVIRRPAQEAALLRDHPEVRLLCGSTAEVYTEWVQQLQQHRATSGHAFRGSTDQERLDNFKRACIRRCSVPALRPGQSVKDASSLHGRWLLTEEQLRVRDSRAELLHISGPAGSGKTVLLVEQGRCWLREGRRLALVVGPEVYLLPNLLLRHLARSVCGEKADEARVSTHRGYKDLLRMLDAASTEDPVSVILDEAMSPADFYPQLLDHVRTGRVRGLWTAYTQPLPDKLETALQREGGSAARLTSCLRCPPHVMALTNSVRKEEELELLPPPVPVTRELGVHVQLISHAHHPQDLHQSWDTCPACRDGVLTFFSGLGLLGGSAPSAKAQRVSAPSALSWRDVVVITTEGLLSDTEPVAAWLRGLGLPALAEKTEILRYRDTDVLLPGVPPQSRDQAEDEAVRSRVMSGEDRDGRPALHVVRCEDFQGMERAVVLLWHWDWLDELRNLQSQEDRDSRLSLHRYFWFRAASRCTGRLAVMATTPSPLLHLLPGPLPAGAELKKSGKKVAAVEEDELKKPSQMTSLKAEDAGTAGAGTEPPPPQSCS